MSGSGTGSKATGSPTYELVTLAEVKSAFALSGTTQDALLNTLISSVSILVEAYCDRQFVARDYVEYQDGKGEPSIVVDHYPINRIDEIADDPSLQWSDSTIIESTAYTYYSNDGIISLIPEYVLWGVEGIFYGGVRNIRIKYNAGYGYTGATGTPPVSSNPDISLIPQDLKSIVIEIIMKKFKSWSNQSIGVQSASVHGVNLNVMLDDILPGHKQILDRKYVRHGIGGNLR